MRTPADVSDLTAQLTSLQGSLREIRTSLSGNNTRARRNEPSPTSLMSRMFNVTGGAWSGSIQEVTGTQRRQYEIVAEQFGDILVQLKQLVEVELQNIETAAEDRGAPWTSGRIPNWTP